MSDQTPVVSMQQLIDIGLNAFALQLFIESIAAKKDAGEFKPITFIFLGIRITFQPEPGMEIDGRHH